MGDVMWDLTHMVNRNDMKTFTAKVVNAVKFSGSFKAEMNTFHLYILSKASLLYGSLMI